MIVRPARILTSLLGLLAVACAPPARVGGAPSTAPAPSKEWGSAKPTGADATFSRDETARATRGAVIPADLSTRMDRLTIADVVDLALGNSPQTRTTWSQARAAASAYVSARGKFLPSLELDGSGGPSKAVTFSNSLLPSTRSSF